MNTIKRAAAVVIGGANLDVKARSTACMTAGTSNPGHGLMTAGGVARNIAENLARLGTRTFLVTAIGRDAAGENLLAQTSAAGVHVEHVYRTDTPTGTYVALLDVDGELVCAVADMSATAELGVDQVSQARNIIATGGLLILDGNLGPLALDHALNLAQTNGVAVILEPVSVPKAALLAKHLDQARRLYAVTPNRDELAALSGLSTRTNRQILAAARDLHSRGVQHVWVRLGSQGSLLSTVGQGATVIPACRTSVVDVTGAGDAMLAAFCHALLDGREPVEAAQYGQAAASVTIASRHTVRPDLTPRLIEAALAEVDQEQHS